MPRPPGSWGAQGVWGPWGHGGDSGCPSPRDSGCPYRNCSREGVLQWMVLLRLSRV